MFRLSPVARRSWLIMLLEYLIRPVGALEFLIRLAVIQPTNLAAGNDDGEK
jgi:hypothetical protein